ncbi:hypothetical protein KKD40_05560 [Candidatus Micrarchaeota archaeon]|nr:hypothetical protein [Candidatus Micrarchaeota archaeon]
MKVNLKKLGAIVAGATILASSAAFAGLMFGSTTLVDDNGAPVAKVVIGSNAAASDGVAAALIATKLASAAYKSSTVTAEVSGDAVCAADGSDGTGGCAISNEKAKLEITVPGSTAMGTWTGENLIGDHLDRQLLDRDYNGAAADVNDSDNAYTIGGSDTVDTANPFTDGNSSNLGQDEIFLYKVGGSQFSPFADQTLTDSKSGNTYVEKQALWLKGDNRFDTSNDVIVGRLEYLVYSIKFDGPGGKEIGIPTCTESNENDYGYCITTDGDIDDATETNRLKVYFLGEEWIISDMNPPSTSSGSEITTENILYPGGSIKLAKESISGILNQGESLPVDDLKFQLDDLEAHGDTTSAIISIVDANGNVLEHDTVTPGTTQEYTINGKEYRFHVYKVAPGYTFGAKWAEVAVFAEELTLESAEELDSDEDSNPEYKVLLGWKNLDAQTDDGDNTEPERDDVDSLRSILIYSDTIDDLASGGDNSMQEGEYIPLIQDPVTWKLYYNGLDLTSSDKVSLKFEIKTTAKTLNADDGPVLNTGTTQSKCSIEPPYVKVTSGNSGSSVFEMDRDDTTGTMSDDEFMVALSSDAGSTNYAARCDANGDGDYTDITDVNITAGSIFMKLSPSSTDYGFSNYTATTVVRYDEIGDGSHAFAPSEGGAILIANEADVDGDTQPGDSALGDMLFSATRNQCASTSCAEFYFAIAEKAGSGTSNGYVDYWVWGIDQTNSASAATFDFDSYNTTSLVITSDANEILYGHATVNAPSGTSANEFYGASGTRTGPVSPGMEMVEEDYVSERGTHFKSIDADSVEFDMAHELAHAQWFLAAADTTTASSSTTVATLGEGESVTVSGVTVKVVEITETVGACSSSGGAVACTADMSDVSAVIMPNNVASLEVAQPYAGNYGNLVILDTDAVGVNTLVSVGGDKVNSVTANLLQGSAVDWSAETKVVREVVQGSKIVVAGKDASDTLEAAQDFVSQLQRVN